MFKHGFHPWVIFHQSQVLYFGLFETWSPSLPQRLFDDGDWITFHAGLGFEHFAFQNVMKSWLCKSTLIKAELSLNFPLPKNCWGTWKADWLAEYSSMQCSFWVGYCDLDAYVIPPAMSHNLSSFLKPYTTWRNSKNRALRDAKKPGDGRVPRMTEGIPHPGWEVSSHLPVSDRKVTWHFSPRMATTPRETKQSSSLRG